jgi:alkaline phosphatase D
MCSKNPHSFSRPAALAATIAALPLLFSINADASDAPVMEQGIQIGDVTQGRAIIWSRADRPARMMVEYAFNEQFTDARTIRGPYAMAESDFTARQDLTGLPDGKPWLLKWEPILSNLIWY